MTTLLRQEHPLLSRQVAGAVHVGRSSLRRISTVAAHYLCLRPLSPQQPAQFRLRLPNKRNNWADFACCSSLSTTSACTGTTHWVYPLHHHHHQQQQVRHYLFLPTSFTEFKLRMRKQAEKRTIQVKLFLDKHSMTRRHKKRSSSWKDYLTDTSKEASGVAKEQQQQQQQQSSPLYTRFRLAAHNQADKWSMYKTKQTTKFRDEARLLQLKARDWMNKTTTRATALKLSSRRLKKRKHRAGRILPAAAFWVRNSSVPLLLRKRSHTNSIQAAADSAAATTTTSNTVKDEVLPSSSSSPHQQQLAPKLSYRSRLKSWYYKKVTLTEYTEKDWFDAATGKPVVSRDATGRFVNPWMSQSADGVHSISTILRWRWQRLQNEWKHLFEKYIGNVNAATNSGATSAAALYRDISMNHAVASPAESQVTVSTTSTQKALSQDAAITSNINKNHVHFTWLGHNTCLLQQENVSILTDPIFSERSSPFANKWIPIGVPRFEDAYQPSIDDDLPPKIDICLISHDHYDHLDKPSVLALKDRVQCWVVPNGIGDWLQEKCEIAVDRIVEMEWWESVQFQQQELKTSNNSNGSSSLIPSWKVTQRFSLQQHPERHPIWSSPTTATTDGEANKSVWVTCCPAQHWCSRTFFDRNYRLWCSFACYLPSATVTMTEPFLFYFAGDTARPNNRFPLFEQIADYLGRPVDLAALPIGAYAPSFLSQDAHMNPAEAVLAHRALRSKQSVGIHWGTFPLAEEPIDEPAEWLRQEMDGADDFVTLSFGGSLRVPMTPLMKSVEPPEGGTLSFSEKDEEESKWSVG